MDVIARALALKAENMITSLSTSHGQLVNLLRYTPDGVARSSPIVPTAGYDTGIVVPSNLGNMVDGNPANPTGTGTTSQSGSSTLSFDLGANYWYLLVGNVTLKNPSSTTSLGVYAYGGTSPSPSFGNASSIMNFYVNNSNLYTVDFDPNTFYGRYLTVQFNFPIANCSWAINEIKAYLLQMPTD
jgi:hypothetical protein